MPITRPSSHRLAADCSGIAKAAEGLRFAGWWSSSTASLRRLRSPVSVRGKGRSSEGPANCHRVHPRNRFCRVLSKFVCFLTDDSEGLLRGVEEPLADVEQASSSITVDVFSTGRLGPVGGLDGLWKPEIGASGSCVRGTRIPYCCSR